MVLLFFMRFAAREKTSMSTTVSSTSRREKTVNEFDGNRALQACFVLNAVEGLLQGYGDTLHLNQESIQGLGTLLRWVHDAVYQDGLIC